jgi:hypothetical protein
MAKQRPLTDRQIECLLAVEDTLYGDIKLTPGWGRSERGLRNRGLIEGERPHVYLTEAGKLALNAHLYGGPERKL